MFLCPFLRTANFVGCINLLIREFFLVWLSCLFCSKTFFSTRRIRWWWPGPRVTTPPHHKDPVWVVHFLRFLVCKWGRCFRPWWPEVRPLTPARGIGFTNRVTETPESQGFVHLLSFRIFHPFKVNMHKSVSSVDCPIEILLHRHVFFLR